MDRQRLALNVDGVPIAVLRFTPEAGGPHPLLCISHGLPPGPRDPSDTGYQPLAERFRLEGFDTFIFNFRGVGESGGDMDMPGWCRDLSAMVDLALSSGGPSADRVNLLGFSAGAAASIYVAAHDPRVSAVAACASPAKFSFLPTVEKAQEFIAHLRKIGLVRSPGFPSSIEEWMAGFQAVSPINWIDRISPRPLLLLHGDQDEVVPLRNAHLLYDKAGQPRDLVVIPGAGHRLRHDPRAVDAAVSWLKKVAVLNRFSLSPPP